MSEPFIAEVKIFAGNFAPRSWAFCDGQLLPISQNQALFSLLGTTYGGDGRTTTALPDLRGRVPVGPRQGPGLNNRNLGQKGGAEDISSVAAHSHSVQVPAVSGEGQNVEPNNRYLAAGEEPTKPYAPGPANTNTASFSSSSAGSTVNDSNMQPYLAINFIIALQGIFPPRN